MTDLLAQWNDLDKILLVLFVQLSFFSLRYRFKANKDEYIPVSLKIKCDFSLYLNTKARVR